jgi:hypothetical protein
MTHSVRRPRRCDVTSPFAQALPAWQMSANACQVPSSSSTAASRQRAIQSVPARVIVSVK